jgi:glycine reductase
MLKDRLVIALGERDGISGTAIAACAEAAGAKVVFVSTECYV